MLPLNREFSVALHERSIDACQDIEELRDVAKSLLRIWQLQASVPEDPQALGRAWYLHANAATTTTVPSPGSSQELLPGHVQGSVLFGPQAMSTGCPVSFCGCAWK